jgi:hypothetical protein
VRVIADVLERAASADPDAVVAAIRTTSVAGGVTVSTGPVVVDEPGDKPNASTAMLRILGRAPRLVSPRHVAERTLVFPHPRARPEHRRRATT